MGFKESAKCFFGFHPRNPAKWIMEQTYWVTTCHNGDTDWEERCPRCNQWHYSKALNKEMSNYNTRVRIHSAPKGWRNGFTTWACGQEKLSLDVGTEQNEHVSCADCLLCALLIKALDKTNGIWMV